MCAYRHNECVCEREDVLHPSTVSEMLSACIYTHTCTTTQRVAKLVVSTFDVVHPLSRTRTRCVYMHTCATTQSLAVLIVSTFIVVLLVSASTAQSVVRFVVCTCTRARQHNVLRCALSLHLLSRPRTRCLYIHTCATTQCCNTRSFYMHRGARSLSIQTTKYCDVRCCHIHMCATTQSVVIHVVSTSIVMPILSASRQDQTL